MSLERYTPNWLRRLRNRPHSELNRWQRSVRYAIELSGHCARELAHDKAGQMAAALTYYTLFSMLPTLVLMLVILQNFVSEDQRNKFKDDLVNTILAPIQAEDEAPTVLDRPDVEPAEVDSSVPDRPASDAPPGDADEQAVQTAAEKKAEFEDARQQIADNIEKVMNQLEKVNFRSIGAVGILLFIWGATALLATIERSFNAVYGVTQGRPWYLRIPLYYTVITLGPLVIFAGQFVQTQLFQTIESGSWTNWLAAPLGAVMPVVTVWLVIYVMYVLLPVTRVSLRRAMIGSFVAAVGWVLAIELFSIYVSGAAISSLYGALALLPLLLLWVYLTWLIVLFGLELTYTLQAMQGRRFKTDDGKRDEQAVIETGWLVPLAAEIARRFESGKLASETDLAKVTDLPQRAIQRMLDVLIESRMIDRVERTGESGFALAKPAERIAVADVLELSQRHFAPASVNQRGPAWQLLDSIHQTAREKADQTTLADLVDRGHAKPAADTPST